MTPHPPHDYPIAEAAPDGRRVLIADDSLLARQLMRRALELSGVAHDLIDVAADGRSAAEQIVARAASGRAYGLVLLDLHMPELTGDDVLRAIRDEPRAAVTPVVVVSGDDSPGRRRELAGLGIAGRIDKPFRPEEIRRIARRAGVCRAA